MKTCTLRVIHIFVVQISSQLFFFNFYFFISWRLITFQYCSGFCHTLKCISHGFTCVPHPDPPSHLSLHPIPLGLPSTLGLSTSLMHPTWAGDLFQQHRNMYIIQSETSQLLEIVSTCVKTDVFQMYFIILNYAMLYIYQTQDTFRHLWPQHPKLFYKNYLIYTHDNRLI